MNKIISKKKHVKRHFERQFERQFERDVELDNGLFVGPKVHQFVHGELYNDINKLIKESVIDELENVQRYLSQKKYRFVKINLFLRPIYVINNLKRVVHIYSKPFKFNEIDNTSNYTNKDLEEDDVIVLLALFNSGQLWFNIKTTKKEGWIRLNNDLIESMKLF